MTALTASRVRELLNYDSETGEFRWKVKSASNTVIGRKAGCLRPDGYISIRVDGRLYQAHRLAWLYIHGAWPDNDIDHANCVRSDNRLINLRAATRAQNCRNSSKRRDNTSGFKGVCWTTRERKWRASIQFAGKTTYLGFFAEKEDAAAAYQIAAAKLHGDFARIAR